MSRPPLAQLPPLDRSLHRVLRQRASIPAGSQRHGPFAANRPRWFTQTSLPSTLARCRVSARRNAVATKNHLGANGGAIPGRSKHHCLCSRRRKRGLARLQSAPVSANRASTERHGYIHRRHGRRSSGRPEGLMQHLSIGVRPGREPRITWPGASSRPERTLWRPMGGQTCGETSDE